MQYTVERRAVKCHSIAAEEEGRSRSESEGAYSQHGPGTAAAEVGVDAVTLHV